MDYGAGHEATGRKAGGAGGCFLVAVRLDRGEGLRNIWMWQVEWMYRQAGVCSKLSCVNRSGSTRRLDVISA